MIWFCIRGNSFSHNSVVSWLGCAFKDALHSVFSNSTTSTNRKEEIAKKSSYCEPRTLRQPKDEMNILYFSALTWKLLVLLFFGIRFAPNNYSTNEWRQHCKHTHTGIHLFSFFDSWFASVSFFSSLAAACEMFHGSVGIVWCVASDLWFPTIAWMICCYT